MARINLYQNESLEGIVDDDCLVIDGGAKGTRTLKVSDIISLIDGKADETTSLGFVYAVPDATQSLSDNTVHVKDATNPNVIYLYMEANVVKGLIIAATDDYSSTQSQYYFAPDGKFRYRTRKKNGTSWPDWPSRFSVLLDEMVFYKIAKDSPTDITNPDREVLLANATEPNTLYKYKNLGLILPATSSTSQTQYYFAEDGVLRYRTRNKTGTSWPDWPTKFKEVINQDIFVTDFLDDTLSTSGKAADSAAAGEALSKKADKATSLSFVYAVPDATQSLSDNTVHVKDATNPNVIYLYMEANVVKGLIIAATDDYSSTQSQYYFAPDGKFRYRQRTIGGTWPTRFSALLDEMVFYKIAKASSVTDPDREVLLANATDPNTLYKYESLGLILPAVSSTTQTQYYFAEDGILRYRTRNKVNGNWESWPTKFKEVINQDILGINLNPYLSPQNKLDKYFVRTCIDKSKVKLDKSSCILGFGDSIMATSDGGSWLNILQIKVGYSTHYNYAVGNAHFSNNSYGGARLITRLNAFFTDVDNQTIDASTINLIIVACGTNDAKNGTPINIFKTDVDEFFTSLKNGFTSRSIECPPVLVITPIRRGTEEEINKVSDDNLEIKVAKYGAILNNLALQAGFSVLNGFDIPVLVDDMDINVGSNTATIASFMYDDNLHVHPNLTTGRTTYAQAVITAIGYSELNLKWLPITGSVFRDVYHNNLSELPLQTYSRINGSTANDTPFDDNLYIFTIGASASMQIAKSVNGRTAVRQKISGSYRAWEYTDGSLNTHGSYGIEFNTNNTYFDSVRILDSKFFNNCYYEGDTKIGDKNDFDSVYPWCDIKKCNIVNDSPIFENENGYDSNSDIFVYIPSFWAGTRTNGSIKQIVVSAYQQGDLHYFKERFIANKLFKRSDNINPATTVDIVLSDFISNHTCFDYESLLALTYLMCVEFNCTNILRKVNKLGYNGTVYNGALAQNSGVTNTVVVSCSANPVNGRNLRNIVIGSQINISDKKHYAIGKTVTNATLNQDGTISITFDGDPITVTAGQTWVDGCPQHIGATDSIPYHTGWTNMPPVDTSGIGQSYSKTFLQRFKYRHIEDIIGNLFTMCVGFAIENNKYVYTYDYNKAIDNTHTNWTKTNYAVPETTLIADKLKENTWLVGCYENNRDKAPFFPSIVGEDNGGGVKKKYGGELSAANVQNCTAFMYGGAFDHYIWSGMLDYRFLASAPRNNHLYGYREIKYL